MPRRRGNRWKGADLKAGGNGWTPWEFPQHDGYKMACCDCGLVHTIDFRIDTNGTPLRTRAGSIIRRVNGNVKWRLSRDNRATAMLRRYKQPTTGKTFLHHAADSLIAVYAENPEHLDRFLNAFRAKVREKIANKDGNSHDHVGS